MSVVIPSLRAAVAVPGWAKNELWRRARAVPSLDLRFADNKSLTDAVTGASLVTFTRASSGTFVDSAGVIQTAATDGPRFGHNPTTLESLGLLVEEARTNLLLRSEEFDNVIWAKSAGTVSANSIASPAGAITADTFVENTSNALHRISGGGAVVSGSTYTTSVYAKYAGRFLYFNCNAAHAARATFDLQSGTVATVGAGSAAIVAMGNGWYRCSVTGVAAATVTEAFYLQLNDTSVAADRTYTGDDTSGIYLWGAQLEAGAFPTSYIPTTTAAVTRSADVASITGSAFSSWYNATEGTVFAAAQSYFPGTQNAIATIFNSASAGNNRYSLRMGNTVVTSDGVQQASFNPTNPIANTDFRLGFAYRTDDIRFAPSYGLSSSDTSATLPLSVNTLEIGKLENFSTLTLNGTMRRLCFWPQRLSNASLQQITQ
jgi:hypothetical protein